MDSETRYVLCDSCGKKIYLNSEVYCFDRYCRVYCSAKCFAEAHATIKALDEEEAENYKCDIWDDKVLEKELDLDSLDFSKCSIDEKFWALVLLIFTTCKDMDFVKNIKERFEVDLDNTHMKRFENQKIFRYKKTGELYNGQIYINGECCTDGQGNEVVYE